jgi:hypothetical protein
MAGMPFRKLRKVIRLIPDSEEGEDPHLFLEDFELGVGVPDPG